ncbi:acyltransferase family protein [Sphingomonas phyllosphaerae]|uniref:acyltransferase family protein n=1 Tax=Sphingomonas phyllosphaerae TaxID=257003 RepID=UPI00241388B7|nr:acyltransferase [Sphingomonas phyllosphaerae]
MVSKGSRYGYVDALRGLAALAVIYFHAGYDALKHGRVNNGWEQSLFWLATDQLDLGKIAVTLFFAISGFVIPFSLRRDGQRPKEAFIVGRIFRLYPAYWLSLPAAFLVEYVMVGKDLGLGTFLVNLTMLQGFVGQQSMQGLYWTLQIELIFYALCFGLFMFVDLRRPKVATTMAALMLACALALAGLRFVTGKQVPVAIPLALFVMFIGLLWRLATVEANLSARRAVMWLCSALLVLMPVIATLAYDEGALRYTLTYYLATGSFLLFTSRIKLTGAILAYLGTISYSVYLFGSLVQKTFEHFLAAWWQDLGLPLHLAIAGMMLVAIGIASLVYRFVEAPAVTVGKAIIQRRLKTSPARADAVAL